MNKVQPEELKPLADESNLSSTSSIPQQMAMTRCDDGLCEVPIENSGMEGGATVSQTATPYEKILNIKLKGPYPAENVMVSQQLWAQRPVVILVVRRLGCTMCRKAMFMVQEIRKEFQKIGVTLIAIANQTINAEDFLETVWEGLPLYIDENSGFQKAVGTPKYSYFWLHNAIYRGCTETLPKAGPSFGDVNSKADQVGLDLVCGLDVTSTGCVLPRFGFRSSPLLLG